MSEEHGEMRKKYESVIHEFIRRLKHKVEELSPDFASDLEWPPYGIPPPSPPKPGTEPKPGLVRGIIFQQQDDGAKFELLIKMHHGASNRTHRSMDVLMQETASG